MRVKVPQKIKLGAHTYSVVFKPDLYMDEKRYGTVNHRLARIDIFPDMPKPALTEFLFHEIIHVIEFMYRISITDEDIDRLAEGFVELMNDNFDIEFDWSEIKELST